MNIWIMRHGEAGFNAQTDSERSLTDFGKAVAFQQGEWLVNRFIDQKIRLDKILISPYLRAQQTADCLLKGMQAVSSEQNFANICETWSEITPTGDLDNVLNYLHFLRDEGAENVLIVSHLPLVFDLVYELTNYREQVHFYPAVIAEMAWETKYAELKDVSMP
ncbi:phosphohistidine phosphatase SixA [Glaesserella sp.]|uniref:phosphohistidine phosphatase SixA n=1 Tax=Glaesserella sp. TaxID=2094731 RepID=UPI0035A1C7F9